MLARWSSSFPRITIALSFQSCEASGMVAEIINKRI